MAVLVHEIWEEPGADGQVLPGLCIAGPDGDGFRRLQHKDARRVGTFEASSHFDAMTLYHRHYGRGPYTSDNPQDHDPYPEEWARRQRGAVRS